MVVAFKGDKLNIRYSDEGSGHLIVLLHGWGANIDIYRSITDRLKAHFRVIALDLPGFGGSDEPSFAYSVEDYADFVLAFLREFEAPRLSLIGHSHGGRIALTLCARSTLPFEIDKIVLVDSAGIVPVKTLRQRWKIGSFKLAKHLLTLSPVKALFPDALEGLRKKSGSADYNAASPILRQSLVKVVNTDLRACMPRIMAPCLLIWGENDTATPLSDAKLMEGLIPGAGLVVLKGAGHYSFLDDPYTFGRVLDSFFGIPSA